MPHSRQVLVPWSVSPGQGQSTARRTGTNAAVSEQGLSWKNERGEQVRGNKTAGLLGGRGKVGIGVGLSPAAAEASLSVSLNIT